MNNTDDISPRPNLRTNGGIVIGQGHMFPGRLPMALTDDPLPGGGATHVFDFTGHQVLGMPHRTDGGLWAVGPVTSPRTRVLSDIWTGSIPSGGCQFWLTDTYDLNKFRSSLITYHLDGTATSVGTPTITTRDIGDTSNVGTYPTIDTSSSSSHRVTAAWLISIVKEVDGKYYLGGAGYLYPLVGRLGDALQYVPLPTWPDEYETQYPI